MQIPHVETDAHAVEALGFLIAELEERVQRGDSTIPHPEEWLQMWSVGLEATRANAAPKVEQLFIRGSQAVRKSSVVDDDEQDKTEGVVQADDPTGAPSKGREYAVPEADSDNLVTLMECEVDGCTNKIPTTKSKPVCHEHEEDAEGITDVGVEDA